MSWNEVEDGMGFAGLVPTAAERREGSEVKRLGDRIVALTKERDDYILKQKVWEAANDELRSEHIRMTARIRGMEALLDECYESGRAPTSDELDRLKIPTALHEQGCEYCGSLEVNPKCPACQGIER